MSDKSPTQPTADDHAIHSLAVRMAQENDVNVRNAERAIRRLLARGLIEMEAPDVRHD